MGGGGGVGIHQSWHLLKNSIPQAAPLTMKASEFTRWCRRGNDEEGAKNRPLPFQDGQLGNNPGLKVGLLQVCCLRAWELVRHAKSQASRTGTSGQWGWDTWWLAGSPGDRRCSENHQGKQSWWPLPVTGIFCLDSYCKFLRI